MFDEIHVFQWNIILIIMNAFIEIMMILAIEFDALQTTGSTLYLALGSSNLIAIRVAP